MISRSQESFDVPRQRTPDHTDVEIGLELKHRRRAAGLSQQQLAVLLGISAQQLSKYERGDNQITVNLFRRHAEATNLRDQLSTGFSEGDAAKFMRRSDEIMHLRTELLAVKVSLEHSIERLDHF